MKHFLPISLLAFFFLVLLTIVYFVKPPKAASISLSKTVTVSATLGEAYLSLFGYTSPLSRVEVSGSAVFAETTSNDKGYFEFGAIYAFPFTREICLTSFDQQNRATNPLCLPTPTFATKKRSVGPVILAPTLSLAKGKFLPGETIEASGQSLPNAEISVSLFRAEPTFWERLIPQVFASTLPVYNIKTDQKGSFSFNLPSTTSNLFRLFTQVRFDNSPSPKSNTLTFKVLTVFEYLLERIRLFLLALYALIKNLPFFETLIILEIIFLFFIWKRSKKHQLMIMNKNIVPLLHGFIAKRQNNNISMYNNETIEQ